METDKRASLPRKPGEEIPDGSAELRRIAEEEAARLGDLAARTGAGRAAMPEILDEKTRKLRELDELLRRARMGQGPAPQ